jgi:Sec-independent protein secretion pathway component TatC
MLTSMKRVTIHLLKRYRSELLMCAFIAQMLLSPLADNRPHAGWLLALALLALIMAGASYMANRRVIRLVVFPLTGLWLAARTLEAFGGNRHISTHLAPVAGLALSCAVLWAILDRFDTIRQATSNVIAEAFISYLIIAVAFSQLYWLLNRTLANPFDQLIPGSQESTLLYFSMITLSGVGYGRIVPINPYLRLIAALESMVGLFYIAVVVSRLVALRGTKNHHVSSEGK